MGALGYILAAAAGIVVGILAAYVYLLRGMTS